MGLAAAKNKRRIGTDPNGTRWSRNTDTFGHKILRAQGWQPGQFLGAKDSAHSHLHTDASASHIRVVLKEDNLGLGAKRNNGDECVGLDAFQNLLGRLNGKSDAVLESERVARESVKLTLYADRKWGPMRFVRGGLLVGDEIDETPVAEQNSKKIGSSSSKIKREVVATNPIIIDETMQASSAVVLDVAQDASAKTSKKRKAYQETEIKQKKKDKKSKRRKTEKEADDKSDNEGSGERKGKGLRKSKDGVDAVERNGSSRSTEKRKKLRKEKGQNSENETSGSQSAVDDPTAMSIPKPETKLKKQKKEKKSKKNKDFEDSMENSEDFLPKKSKLDDSEASEIDAPQPTPTGVSTPDTFPSGRHLARRRFIAQKRMAFADPKALSQIFMIKS